MRSTAQPASKPLNVCIMVRGSYETFLVAISPDPSAHFSRSESMNAAFDMRDDPYSTTSKAVSTGKVNA